MVHKLKKDRKQKRKNFFKNGQTYENTKKFINEKIKNEEKTNSRRDAKKLTYDFQT